jgi:hypothetical protein
MSYKTEYRILALDTGEKQLQENVNLIRFDCGISNNLISQLGIERANLYWSVPNINPQNNTFYYDNGTQTFPITINNGWYDLVSLASQIQLIVRATTGDATFTCTTEAPDVTLPYVQSSVFGRLNFASLATQVGVVLVTPQVAHTYGFYDHPASSSSIVWNVAGLTYTDYIDVVMEDLLQDAKADVTHINNQVKLITRIYLQGGIAPFQDLQVWNNIKWSCFNVGRSLGIVTLKLYDQFFQPLYTNGAQGVRLQMTLYLA